MGYDGERSLTTLHTFHPYTLAKTQNAICLHPRRRIELLIFGSKCSVLICKASFNLFRVKWQLLKSCVLPKAQDGWIASHVMNYFHTLFICWPQNICQSLRSVLYFHDCSSCLSSTARWLSRPAVLMREAWSGWAFLPWRPWIELCSAARHKGLIVESFACHCKCYYISSLHSLHVIVEKNLSLDVITHCIECFLCYLKKTGLGLAADPKRHDTAAVGRTFLRSPPPLSCCSACSAKLEAPFGTRGGLSWLSKNTTRCSL